LLAGLADAEEIEDWRAFYEAEFACWRHRYFEFEAARRAWHATVTR
jgi:hypothetical protein